MSEEVIRTGHDVGEHCACVNNHNPNPMELHQHHIWPMGMNGPDVEDNVVWLCPTSHVNVHELLRAWVKYESKPPWSIRKFFSPYIRALAAEGFNRWMDAGRP